MQITHLTRIRVLAVLALLTSTGAHADLMYARLGGAAVYDATTNLTWVSNANLAATNAFGVSGIDPAGSMSWAIANSWIAGMDAANYLGYNNWALPTTLQPDATCGTQSGGVSSGYGCTGSQMGNLFYNGLGGLAGSSITTTHNANYNLFSNFQFNYYWSGTEYAPDTYVVGIFHLGIGGQDAELKGFSHYALAVRPGDVGGGPSAVPEPASVALLGIGLLGLMGARRRKQTA